MDVEALGLEAGESVSDDLEAFAHGVEMVESLFEAEVAQIIGADLVAQKARELFVLLEKGILPVSAKDVVAVLDLIDYRGEFPVQPFVQADAENLADAVSSEAPQADLAASLEDLVNRKMTLEDEVPAVFDLGYGIETRQTQRAALLL